MLDVKVDPKVQKKLNKLGKSLGRAMVMTLNDTALIAAKVQRNDLKKRFILRTKWTAGSIFPKEGRRLGLIPERKFNVNKVFARTGSIQEYLARQEEGFAATDPQVPSNKARIGRSRRRRLSKRGKLRTIKSSSLFKPSALRKLEKKDRVPVMIQILRKSKFKGYIHIDKKGHALPPGFYKMRNRRTLDLLRLSQKGRRRRRATRWHSLAMRKKVIFTRQQLHFNKNSAYLMKRYGIK
jgi:hypothetical protein